MTPQIQNADLMKDYFHSLLVQHGLERDANSLRGVTISRPDEAMAVASIVQSMPLMNGKTPREILNAKTTLLKRLDEAAS